MAFLLFAIIKIVMNKDYMHGIWLAGIGEVLVVLVLLLCTGWNNTVYYLSYADLQSSLTVANGRSSKFTLGVIAVVLLFIPFVLAYIVYVWCTMDSKKVYNEEIE